MSLPTLPPTDQSPAEPPPLPDGGGMLVSFSPVALAQRTAKLLRQVWFRVFGLVLSVVISVVWYVLVAPERDSILFWLLIASVVLSLGRLVFAIVQQRLARRATSRIPLGPAFQIDNQGVVLSTIAEGERLDWAQVRQIAGRNRHLAPGPVLEVSWPDRSWTVPIIALDAPPSVIDSALRAFSLGRFGLDLSSVDDIW